MKNRSLSLRGDRLGELTAEELTEVVAGATQGCIAVTPACPTFGCTGCHLTCSC